jgi:methylmalonyl-CoA/ethylmalonyl-CoA epimerase
MKINKLDHICIAVRNLEAAKRIWEPILGKNAPDDAYIDEPEKIKVARYWVGGVGFELMESLTPDGDVAKFIDKRGEGVMLISLNVGNTRDAMVELKAKGYPFIGGARPFRDSEFAFIHPKAVNGVLLELIDYPWRELQGQH